MNGVERQPAGRNRTGLAIVGALLLLLALAALARIVNLMPGVLGPNDTAVGDARMRELTTDNTWFWVLVAIGSVIVALLALIWLFSQAQANTVRTLRLEPDSRHGSTTVPARAVTNALEDDLLDTADYRQAQGTVTGRPTTPRLHLAATLAPTADIEAARHRLEEALDRQRQTLATEDLPTTVLLRSGR